MSNLPEDTQRAIERAGGDQNAKYLGPDGKDYSMANSPTDRKRNILRSMTKVKTSEAWSTCSCQPQSYRAGVVLDPFAGSGTTALEAKNLGRSSISIELNPSYITILKKRIGFGVPTLDNEMEYVEVSIPVS